jgi:hypothetical protein
MLLRTSFFIKIALGVTVVGGILYLFTNQAGSIEYNPNATSTVHKLVASTTATVPPLVDTPPPFIVTHLPTPTHY